MSSKPTSANRIRGAILVLALLWYGAIGLDWAVGESRWLPPVLLVLFVVTCICLRATTTAHVELPSFAKWLAVPILAWLVFVLWGVLSFHITLQDLVQRPSKFALVMVFLNGPVSAIILGAVLAYPIAALFKRSFWVVAILLCLPIILIQWPGPFDASMRPMTRAVLTTELLSLFVVLLTFPRLVRSWIERKAVRPAHKKRRTSH